MTNLVIFVSSFIFLLTSIIGYGVLFNNLCFKKLDDLHSENSIFVGFYGLFFVTLISLFSSLFFQHNFIHNIILNFIGVLLLIFLPIKNKKKFLFYILLITILLFTALLISKTHDDFSYYHLPFTKYLTEHKIIFGMGHLNHGYNLLSSSFFLNSVFYLPFIEYYSFHFPLLFFLIFFNYFILKETFKTSNKDILKFLYIFAFVFFNLSFNRIAEYGTDKAGQLLIVILIIKFFQHTCIDKGKKNIINVLFLIPLLALCISLKTYFLPYIILGVLILLIDDKKFNILKKILLTKSFLFFSALLILNFLHHFISTGCVISPLPFTCFGELTIWGKDLDVINGLSIWLEQWAKAGAGPNFRVENIDEYIANIQWVPHWFEKYFLVKFLDQLAILITTFIVVFFILKKFEFKQNKIILNKNFYYFYFLLVFIFLIWFLKHPTLRYGGYSIVFLVLSIPVAILFNNIKNKKFYYKKLNFLIILIIVLFNLKNIDRIYKEFKRGDLYKFTNFPFFAVDEKEFSSKKFNSGLTIFSAHHCWATPSPCGHINKKTKVLKKGDYYFIIQNK